MKTHAAVPTSPFVSHLQSEVVFDYFFFTKVLCVSDFIQSNKPTKITFSYTFIRQRLFSRCSELILIFKYANISALTIFVNFYISQRKAIESVSNTECKLSRHFQTTLAKSFLNSIRPGTRQGIMSR